MTIKTPPLHAKGLYTVTSPFALTANTIYECMAIRSFPDIVQLGIDVFKTYYEPLGLLESNYEADKAAGANIITLMSTDQPTVHVPDTYISAYPNMGNVAFNNVVLAMSIGPVPDGLDLTFLKQQLKATASDVIGLEPNISVAVAPSTGVITQTQADDLEVARQAAITNRTTDHAKLLALQGQYDTLQGQYTALVDLMKSKGYIPA